MKWLLGGAGVVVVLAGGFWALNSYVYQQKQEGAAIEQYRATLAGEYVCLPHKDTTGPQTDECEAGLRTDTGEYFAFNLQLMSQAHEPLVVGQRIRANGVVHPVEMLSTDYWQRYPIVGIFSITDSLQVLE
jgi:hypothetical protein